MRIERWIPAATILSLFAFATVVRAEDEEKKGKGELPAAVKKALKAKFPGATIRGIAKEKNEEGETIYEVELTVKTNVNVNFDAKGEIEVIERAIGVFELPEVVRKAAAKAFPKGKIVRAETVVEEEGELKYEVLIHLKGKKPFEVVMAGNGKILKNGAKEAKDDDDKKARGKKDKDDDDEDDDKKARGKKDKDDDEDDDKKARGKKDKDDDDEDDDKKARGKKDKDDDDEDDDKKARGKKDKDDDDEDDDKKARGKKDKDDDDEDDKKARGKKDKDDDDEDDDKKARGKKDKDDDEDDDKKARGKKDKDDDEDGDDDDDDKA